MRKIRQICKVSAKYLNVREMSVLRGAVGPRVPFFLIDFNRLLQVYKLEGKLLVLETFRLPLPSRTRYVELITSCAAYRLRETKTTF